MNNNQKGDMMNRIAECHLAVPSQTSLVSLGSSLSSLKSLEQSVECSRLSDFVVLQTERLDFNKLVLHTQTYRL